MFLYDLIPNQIIIILFLSIAGLVIRSSLVLSGQKWANTFHHLGTYILLPNITFIITTTIANNIALSLGMIGALSIVRFRHPVRSPFELTIFFGLITLGISSSVNLKYSFLLFILIVIVIIFIDLIHSFFKKFNFTLYNTSFSEGSAKNTIELETKINMSVFSDNENLYNSSYSEDTKIWQYKMIFRNRDDLKEFINSLSNNDNIISYHSSFDN